MKVPAVLWTVVNVLAVIILTFGVYFEGFAKIFEGSLGLKLWQITLLRIANELAAAFDLVAIILLMHSGLKLLQQEQQFEQQHQQVNVVVIQKEENRYGKVLKKVFTVIYLLTLLPHIIGSCLGLYNCRKCDFVSGSTGGGHGGPFCIIIQLLTIQVAVATSALIIAGQVLKSTFITVNRRASAITSGEEALK
jgi:hypothetical protein